MSAKPTKTIIALGVAALTGCELAAGIQDLTYAPPDLGSADAGGSEDVTLGQGDSGVDAPEGPDAGADQSAVVPDGSEADSQNDAFGDAVRDTSPATLGSPDAGDATSVPDGVDGAQGGNAPDAAPDSDAGLIPSAAPIPGPDGGPLAADGGDGGPLLGEIIDDIDSETMPGWILIKSGRVGTWFTYADGTPGGVSPAPMSPPAMSVGPIVGWDGRAGNLAAHVTGNGLAAYAGMGFDLNAYNNVASTYDATAYRGFVFWGRIGGDSGTLPVKFAVPDMNTDAAGGICSAASDGSVSGCSDYFSKPLTLTPTWRQFVVYFSQLAQVGFGRPKGLPGLDAAHVYSCQFQLAPGSAFDIWVDDIYFISK